MSQKKAIRTICVKMPKFNELKFKGGPASIFGVRAHYRAPGTQLIVWSVQVRCGFEGLPRRLKIAGLSENLAVCAYFWCVLQKSDTINLCKNAKIQ